MKDKFVPYEIAKRLKELGFKEPCITYWYTTKENRTPEIMFRDADIKNGWINGEGCNTTAPIWQDVIDWLKINHKITVEQFSTVKSFKTVSFESIWRVQQFGNPKKYRDVNLKSRESAIKKALTFVTPL